jgi:DNA-binding MarR family transcriptional regulator
VTDDPTDLIAAALARLRGPRPRPPWADGREHGHEHGHGPHPGRGAYPGPWGHGDRGGFGPPPWMERGRGRFGGPARLRLLDALAAASDPLTVSEAAEAIGVDQPRASRLVQQAVAEGLVRREADPDDARRTRIALTDAGSAIVGRFRGERRDAVRTALEGFSDDERTELARLLAKLADAWPRE